MNKTEYELCSVTCKSIHSANTEYEIQMTGFYMLLCTVAGVLTLSAISFDRFADQDQTTRIHISSTVCHKNPEYFPLIVFLKNGQVDL